MDKTSYNQGRLDALNDIAEFITDYNPTEHGVSINNVERDIMRFIASLKDFAENGIEVTDRWISAQLTRIGVVKGLYTYGYIMGKYIRLVGEDADWIILKEDGKKLLLSLPNKAGWDVFKQAIAKYPDRTNEWAKKNDL